jgi:RimJ/RimL family protein N-acetyltransferase
MKTILLDLPMPISTPHLLIRPIQVSDGAAINAAVLESFDRLRHFMVWAKEKPSVNESEEFARLAAANWVLKKSEDPWLQLGIFDKDTKQFIGGTGFQNIVWEIPSFEIGYWIRTSRAQQGLMTEAINALTQYAFKQLGAKRVAITCDIDNVRSKKVPERLGYLLEATLKYTKRKPLTNELCDTMIYTRHDDNALPDVTVTWNKEK